MDPRRKVSFKAPITLPTGADDGEFEAIVATLNVVDRDGDVILSGAFEDGADIRVVWHHDWTRPVGRAVLTEETIDGRPRMVARGRFFTETASGDEAHKLVKAMGDLQEWSWGFYILEGGARLGEMEGRDVMFLGPRDDGSPGLEVFEASPVLLGAGVDTRTMAIKHADLNATDDGGGGHTMSAETVDDGTLILIKTGDQVIASVPTSDLVSGRFTPDDDAGRSLAGEVADVARGLRQLTGRLDDVLTLRAAKGRTLGADTRSQVDALIDAVEAFGDVTDRLDDEGSPPDSVPAVKTDDEPDRDSLALWLDIQRAHYESMLRTPHHD